MGLGIAVIQQISGVNAIMYYSTTILADAGFGTTGALWATIANGVVSVAAATTVFFPVLVNLLGISGTFFIFVALGIAGLVFLKVYMPETKAKSLEELAEEIKTGDKEALFREGGRIEPASTPTS